METRDSRAMPAAPSAADEGAQLADLYANWAKAFGLRWRASLKLAMAETRLALSTFIMMIFLVVLAAGAVVLAWALFVLALVQALSLAGLQLFVAVLVIAVAHLAAAWGLWRFANRLGRHMEFRATRSLLESH